MNSSQAADDVIAQLKKLGVDYSQYHAEIAVVFDEGIWEGMWDCTTGIADAKNLRFIQEDEYDNEGGPARDEMIGTAGGCYFWWE